MDSLPRRAKHRFGRMINSAVAVINNSSTLRRRSHFSRSATTNSYGPVPIDGDSSVPLMYSSQRSNSTTSSTNSIVSIPGLGAVSNLIQVRSLEQSVDSDLNEQNKSSGSSSSVAPPSASGAAGRNEDVLTTPGLVKIAEFLFVTNNKELLDSDGLANLGISHLITIGHDAPTATSVSKKDGLLLNIPVTLFHNVDINPNSQSFKSLVSKFDSVNLFIENARKLNRPKIVIYSKRLSTAYFLGAQFFVDYYQLEPKKASNHLMKVAREEWEELSEKCMSTLQKWKKLGEERRADAPPDSKLDLSVRFQKA